MIEANSAIPDRVFKGIYEILGYVRELLKEHKEKGRDKDDHDRNEDERKVELADIPDRIDLTAVSVKANGVFSYTVESHSDLAEAMPLYIQILKKNNEVVQGSINGSFEMRGDGGKVKQSFSMFVDLFRDVRRIEEFVTIKKVGDAEIKQTFIVGHLDNKDLVISILKEDKIRQEPVESNA